jgi:hypothetical protein
MKRGFYIVLLIVLFSPAINGQNPDFCREDLTFTLSDSNFSVSGYYYFMNPSQQSISLNMLYPFPESQGDYGCISNVYAFINGDSLQDKLITYNDKAALIRLEIKPKESTIIFIGYTQEILKEKAEYILSSTKSWGKPLKQASYTLIVPQSIAVDSLSYIPDHSKIESGNVIYYYYKEDFMPDREFEIFIRL